MSIAQSILPEFDQEMANTRRTLERVPADKPDWKPHERSFSMLQMAGHMANLLSWTLASMDHDEFDLAPKDGPAWTPPPIDSVAAALATFDQNVTAARAAIEKASDEHFMATWSLLTGGETMLSMPRIAVIRSFILNHMVHHRGQLTVYLRLNDVAVPALYGPSADEEMGRP